MAKNKSRSSASAKAKPNNAPYNGEMKNAGSSGSSGKSQAKPKEVLYQVKTKRDSGVLKAYITFTYRMMHPGVSARLVLYGLIVALPGIFFFRDLYWKIFFTCIGVLMILLGLFRQYISLWLTKRNDPDYKSGAEFTYNFTVNDADFLKNGDRFSGIGKYKDITGFYHDDSYLYMGMKNKEIIVIPKDAFTIGDSDSFEEFIYKKSKKTCHWLPDNFRDAMKQRRAQRAVSSGDMIKK
ncbi:MAG: YcxB family protein [Mogibacterium sp.]|nr:YcxB family protein [Mogibacterium sp.]MBQ6500209.1 YcxB family protein [Mogibacterium sp.]